MASALTLALVLVAGLCAANGDPASIEEFPSAAQVAFGATIINLQVCSGVIITNRHILSAARCFSGPLFDPRTRKVRVGAERRGRGGTVVGVESVTNHPSFGDNQHDGDISVVRLDTTLTYDATVQNVPIVSQDFSLPAFSLPVIHAGWGRTSQGSLWPSLDLNSIVLNTVSEQACQEKYASLPLIEVDITPNMFCAGVGADGGTNFDPRDAGGPVYYDGVLIGIFSIGMPFVDSFPAVATKISSYSDWIVGAAV